MLLLSPAAVLRGHKHILGCEWDSLKPNKVQSSHLQIKDRKKKKCSPVTIKLLSNRNTQKI